MVLDVSHSPAVPKSTDNVTVTARLADETPFGLTAELFFRFDRDTGRIIYVHADV